MTASNVFERRLGARLVIAVVAIGVMSFAGVVVETAMNITFPALMSEFGVSTSTVQWITTGYLLVLAVIMPISSLLNRRFRTRSLLVAAGLAFLAGTLLCALAPGFAALVLGRLIQGVGAGIALPLMFNLVLEQAPLDRLGMMMGIATLITSIAPAVGPSLGGFLIGAYGWRPVFWVLVQATVLALGYLIPYYAQVADAMGSFAAGCLLLPGCIVGACLTPFGGRVLDVLGPARPIRTGALPSAWQRWFSSLCSAPPVRPRAWPGYMSSCLSARACPSPTP